MADNKRAKLTQFLNQQYLCESLTVKEVETLLDYTELTAYKKDDVIADIGEVGEALFFVVTGEAALLHDAGGREIEVGRMKEGELMGEMSFFARHPRSLRMRALRPETPLPRRRRRFASPNSCGAPRARRNFPKMRAGRWRSSGAPTRASRVPLTSSPACAASRAPARPPAAHASSISSPSTSSGAWPIFRVMVMRGCPRP